MAKKQVFGSEGKVAAMGCKTFALRAGFRFLKIALCLTTGAYEMFGISRISASTVY